MIDFLIVGSGLYGSVFAHLANKQNKKVLVIDKRNHLGGNIFCENIENINVHKYGAHIFHTSNKKVWDFVNSFAEFNSYINSPIANYNGKLYNLPFNMNTFYQMWGTSTPVEAQIIIKNQSNISSPKNLEEQAISLVGTDIYKILIKDYTEKQWGTDCKNLPPEIIKRLPVRFTFNNNYFNDRYQGIPIGGYNKIINGLLEGIETKINTDFFANKKYFKSIAKNIIFTGKIDEYFNYQFGELEYRSVYFENEILNVQNFQGNAVINYTSHSEPFTRIIEHKHFEPENPFYNENKTIISKEYSTKWTKDKEAFYPINNKKNMELLEKYKALQKSEKNVIFGGRLAEYKYYDMDDVIEKAIEDSKLYLNS